MQPRRVVSGLPCVSAPALKGKGNVFYVGENQHREMTGRRYHTSLHAEMNALFKSIKSRDKRNRILNKRNYQRPAMTIYVVRLLKGIPCEGNNPFAFGCSQPCINCQKYLAEYNITRIKYTDIIGGKSVLCELRLK
jgi:deoxycytidylate deaminase